MDGGIDAKLEAVLTSLSVSYCGILKHLGVYDFDFGEMSMLHEVLWLHLQQI